MWRLIFANLRHKTGRTLLTLAGLAVATGTLFSLLAFERGYAKGLQRELAQLGAHILVVPKGCPYDAASLALHGANWPCYLKGAYLAQVQQTPGVAIAAPVLMAAGYKDKPNVIVGITRDYLQLRPAWRIQGSFSDRPGTVLLGAEAARVLNVRAGDEVHLGGLKRPFTVSGTLQPTAGPEDEFCFIQLREAQTAFKRPDQLTHLLVKLKSPELLDKTVEALRGCDAGMQMNIVPLAHLFETIRNISASAKYLLAGISAIAFLVGGTTLANTMLMAVLERTREIGVLRAIGASKSQIFWIFVSETMVLGLTGALAGTVLALICSRFIEAWVRSRIAYAPGAPLIQFDFPALLLSSAFALIVSVLVALLPAWRAARLPPVEAFRLQAAY